MKGLVLDASAAIEIVCETELGKKLFKVLDRFSTWWVPDLFHVEAAAGLRNLYLRQKLTSDVATLGLRRDLDFPLLTSDLRLSRSPNVGVEFLEVGDF